MSLSSIEALRNMRSFFLKKATLFKASSGETLDKRGACPSPLSLSLPLFAFPILFYCGLSSGTEFQPAANFFPLWIKFPQHRCCNREDLWTPLHAYMKFLLGLKDLNCLEKHFGWETSRLRCRHEKECSKAKRHETPCLFRNTVLLVHQGHLS